MEVVTLKVPHPIIKIEILLLILFLIIVFTVPFIINQKKELPNGTLMSRNRFNGQISVKFPNDEFIHFQKGNPFYEEMLDLFNDH